MGLFYYKIFDRQVHIRVHHPVAPAKESADQGQQSAHSGQRDFYLLGAQILFYGAQGLSGLSGLLFLYRSLMGRGIHFSQQGRAGGTVAHVLCHIGGSLFVADVIFIKGQKVLNQVAG